MNSAKGWGVGEMVELLAGLTEEACAPDTAAAGYAQLRRLVGGSLRSREVEAARDADDFVNDLLLGLLEAKAAGRVEAEWRSLSRPDVVAVVRRKTRRLACEKRPGWNAYRALRSHLVQAVNGGLPVRPDAEPTSLYVGETLSGPLVAAAAAWLVWEHGLPRRVDALLAELKPRLRGTFPSRFDPVDEAGPEGADTAVASVETRLEAGRLHARIQATLGEQAARLYGGRLAGRRLAELGAEEGIGVATVHDRARKAEAKVEAVIREADCGPVAAGLALELLASGLGR